MPVLEKQPSSDYKIFRVDKDDTTLLRLLTADAILRSLVIRAEGYRIIVEQKNITRFENRLKLYGYLV